MSKQNAGPTPSVSQANQPGKPNQTEPRGSDFNSIKSQDHPDSNWNQSVSGISQADPFCCRTEWQLSFHEAMEPNRRLIYRETPGSAVVFAEQSGSYPGPLLVPVESNWMFGCPLLGPDAVDLLDDVLGQIESGSTTRRAPPAFVISGLRPRGTPLRQITTKFRSRFNLQSAGSSVLCSASLAGGLDGYLSRRSSSHRRGLQKQARRAAKSGIVFERHAPANKAEAEAIYGRMLAVESSSWKGIGKCGMTIQPSRDYYACMLRRLAVSGNSRVIFACHGKRDIGFIFGGLAGKVYRGQQFSYADDWENASIGNLLQIEQIRWLCEEGATRYDMGPLMGYKRHWTEKRTVIETRVLKQK